MATGNSEVLNLIDFGDGRSIGSGQIGEELLNPSVPWSEKVYWQAKSNGCPQPDTVQKEIAQAHPEIIDPEEIARLATYEYTRQNFVYGFMVRRASQKENQELLEDITEISYPRPEIEHLEPEHTPDWFSKDKIAKGMSRDPAFLIAKKVSDVLVADLPQEARYTEYMRLIDILEEKVGTSNTLQELHDQFFEAIK